MTKTKSDTMEDINKENTAADEKPEAENAANNNEPENKEQQSAEDKAEGPLSLEDQIKDLEDRNLRLLAEMQNMRARNQKDLKDAREYAVTGFANDMIGLSENIYRARANIPDSNDELYQNLLKGIDMIIDELKKVFNRHGIERVSPKAGDKFDYKFHQAVVQVPTDEFAEGCIVSLINAGYLLKDRVLQPAMVAVAKKPPVTAAPENAEGSNASH